MSAQNEQERRRLGVEVARSRKLRDRNWSQEELARRAGIRARRTVTAVERGERVDDQTLFKIEVAFGWPSGTADAIARGRRPNPDGDTPHADGPPIEDLAAVTMSDREFDELTRDSIRLAPIMRKTHGDNWTDQYLRRLVDVAILRDRTFGEHLARMLGVAHTAE